MAWVDTLRSQYVHCWKMLGSGIDNCPDEYWKKVVDDPFFVPARVAFHIIQTADYYAGVRSEDFDWSAFGFDWEADAAELMPDRPVIRDYLSQVQNKVTAFIESKGDDALLGGDESFSPQFESPLARVVYSLRHSHHHIGQLSLDLQRRGLPEIPW